MESEFKDTFTSIQTRIVKEFRQLNFKGTLNTILILGRLLGTLEFLEYGNFVKFVWGNRRSRPRETDGGG